MKDLFFKLYLLAMLLIALYIFSPIFVFLIRLGLELAIFVVCVALAIAGIAFIVKAGLWFFKQIFKK